MAFAELICDYCLEVEPGQNVLVSTTSLAEPLVIEIQAAMLARHAWPVIRLTLPDQEERWFADARDVHLDTMSRAEGSDVQLADSFLTINAPADPYGLSRVDPHRKRRRDEARATLGHLRLQRRWCSTLWPTDGLARVAGMSLEGFGAFVSRALFLDSEDPAGEWGKLRERQALLIDRLRAARMMKIEGEGTELTLDVSGRTWVNSDGKRNMPSGEVFTGPIEDSANGSITFSLPSAHQGNHVAGVRLKFVDGLVVEAAADVGQDYLEAMISSDPGARRLGEVGIGTNFGIDRPISNILFDEKIGGTVHLALGRSYPETGGMNDSMIHWDLICDLREVGRVTLDGEPLDVRSHMI